MINLLKLELFRIRKSRGLKILVLVVAILGIITFFSYYASIKNSPVPNDPNFVTEELSTGMEGFIDTYSETGLLFMLAAVIIGISICSDFEQRTFNNYLSIGHKRAHLLLSKFIGYVIQIFIIVPIYPIVYGICLTIVNRFGAPFTIGTILYLLKQLFFTSFIYASFTSITFFIACLLHGTALTVIVSLLTTLLLGPALNLLVDILPFLKPVVQASPLYLTGIFLDPNVSLATGAGALFSSTVGLVLVFFISYLIFRKRDLK